MARVKHFPDRSFRPAGYKREGVRPYASQHHAPARWIKFGRVDADHLPHIFQPSSARLRPTSAAALRTHVQCGEGGALTDWGVQKHHQGVCWSIEIAQQFSYRRSGLKKHGECETDTHIRKDYGMSKQENFACCLM
jgi:hypothetical protein